MNIDWRRWILISIPMLWLLVFFLVPFFIVLKISLSDLATAIPPYVPILNTEEGFFAGLSNFFKALDFEKLSLVVGG